MPNKVKFTIFNLRNPMAKLKTDNFAFSSYTHDGYKIDSITNELSLNFICALPCKTCETGSNTKCNSCLKNSRFSNKPILHK